ncbi:MAG: long-chain fatty acid--CoA ligase [Clostridiales bacterium]|nr:long-chain fatty acid--CoA ligase [Clostridiales bacterium]
MMRKPIHKFTKYSDLKEMLQESGKKFGDRPAYIFKTEKKDKFMEITHKEFRDEINNLGTKLIDMGLKDKRIAVISENRYEWAVDYLAVATGVGVIVPLDKALPDNEIENLIIRSEVEAIFYSKKYNEVMNKIKEQKNTNLKYFISMDLEKEEDGIKSQKELTEQGKVLIDNGNKEFLNAKIDNEKMGIMLFTSGTTAMSKAVMLSHKNICSNLADITSVIKVTEKDRFLSFLPLHHTFECTVGFLYPISVGGAICFCDGIRHIAENIKEYKITAMISVPILFESMYKKVMKGIEKKGKLETVKKGMKISQFLLKFGIDIRKQLFKEIHQTLGEDARLFVSGGAALDPETEKGFNAMGFTMYQGYGLTESSPVIAAEDDKYQRIGSIGKAFPSIEAKIINPDEDGIGELVAKGPSIMLGYYNNEEATKETLEGEWLHTGDLARIDKDGYIFISGRKKFVIVLKNGKNIFPEELETLVNKIEGVKESFVYGRPEDDGDYKICAKLVYDPEVVKEKYGTTDEKELKDILWKEVKKVNKEMPAYKYIRDISVTDKELIKTTTQKTKRAEEIKTVL